MKKTILYILLFCSMSYVHAQNDNQEVTVTLNTFTSIKVFDGLSVNLIKGSENKAVITGANTGNVVFVNKEGLLKIRMELKKVFSGYRTFIDLYYTQNLGVIDVNEDAKISTKTIIIQDVLELKAQEGGELIIDAEVEQLLVKTVSGGVVTTNGSSKLQDVAINTGGIYEGENFKTSYSTINVNAGSSASIYATDYVKATVKAGGEVKVYGNPPKIDKKTIFGGKITKM